MARNDHLFLYLRGYARAHILVWIHFILPPYTREKNHLDNAGIEPGSPALQASTLSIMLSPLGLQDVQLGRAKIGKTEFPPAHLLSKNCE